MLGATGNGRKTWDAVLKSELSELEVQPLGPRNRPSGSAAVGVLQCSYVLPVNTHDVSGWNRGMDSDLGFR